MKRILAALGVAFLATLAFAAPASAQTDPPECGTWVLRSTDDNQTWDNPHLGSSMTRVRVQLAKSEGWGTEASNHDMNLRGTPNLTVTANYVMSSTASYAGGAVRMFGYRNANVNTLTGPAPDQVAVASTATEFPGQPGRGSLTFTITQLGTFGFTYDASNTAGGSVTFSEVRINGTPVLFDAETCPPAQANPTPSASASSPAASPTPSATRPTRPAGGVAGGSGNNIGGGSLANTDDSPRGLVIGGIAALLVGGALMGIFYATRRRETFQA